VIETASRHDDVVDIEARRGATKPVAGLDRRITERGIRIMVRAFSSADPATLSSCFVVPDQPEPVTGGPLDEFAFTITTARPGSPAVEQAVPGAGMQQASAFPALALVHWLTHSLIAGAGWLVPGLGQDLQAVRDSLRLARELIRAGLALHDLASRLDTTQVGASGGATPSVPAPTAPDAGPGIGSRSIVAASADAGLPWRHRLVFDAAISDGSPVVQGTWVTVEQVVSMVVDGWSWAEILSALPELTEDDIRACLNYSVEEEGAGLYVPRD
jgi:uncharacterized protein (DUF433 family)